MKYEHSVSIEITSSPVSSFLLFIEHRRSKRPYSEFSGIIRRKRVRYVENTVVQGSGMK